MALRLAGEDYSVVQGLDGLGWLRDIAVNSSAPALKVDQKGSGSILDLLDNGTPVLRVLNGGNLGFLVGKALTAGQYEIGRNADATNRLQYNVPTGAKHEFSINDAAEIIYSTGLMEFQQQTTIQAADGFHLLINAQAPNYRIKLLGHTQVKDTARLFFGSGDDYYFQYANPNLELVSSSGGLVYVIADGANEIEFQGGVGMFSVAPPSTQPAKINDPSGGATIDAEARTAINAIIDALEGTGITAAA